VDTLEHFAGRGAGSLHRHDDFPSSVLGNTRHLEVYVPPGYDADPALRCPTLYLHDGQNLFDPATAAFGVAWDAHTTADRLIRSGAIPPVLLVGIRNTPARMDEYTTRRDPGEKVGGRGRRYARFVACEVKPFIDAHYRTRPERELTGVAGSSLGGLVSLTIAREFHHLFGLCGALSPSLWWARGQVLRGLRVGPSWMRGVRFWLDVGTSEGGLERTRELAALFRATGLEPGRGYVYDEVAGGEHNEAAWAARFGDVLRFFFGGEGSSLAPQARRGRS
jgi:predicted alpha/beta superfamily hydrolase